MHHPRDHSSATHAPAGLGTTHYRHLVVMLALSFLCMYALMYAMVDPGPMCS
jgi:hypothetical protein